MSGGSKPSGQQVVTTQQNTGPWSGQQPYLQDAFAIARQQLATDAASGQPAFYPGQTYISASPWTNSGVNNMLGRATLAGTTNGVQGEKALAGQANRYLSNGISGTPGAGLLASTANGDMIGRNPEFQGMVQRGMEALRPSIDSQFAAGGRLGSGAHANAMASAGANMAGNLAYQDYTQERGNQLNAAQQLMQGDMAARQLGAGFQQQAGANDQSNIDAMLKGGAIAEDYGQKALTDQINRWNYNQNLPWDQLGRYTSIIQGNYGQSGTTQQISPVYGNSMLSTLFGGAGALGGLASGVGSLATAFGLSDARAKENIRPVGALDNGLTVYAYNYKGDDLPQIGLLAQEVAQVRPEAVAQRHDGLLGVNYDAATR